MHIEENIVKTELVEVMIMFDLDICMCKGNECPLKNKCIRYVAKPDKWQTYFCIVPYKKGECNEFIDFKKYNSKWIREEFLK